MLLQYGDVTVPPSWRVDEKTPPGYARIYHVHGGEVCYIDEGCRCRLRAGFLYILPSAAAYRMIYDPARPLQCTFLHIDLLPVLVPALIEIPVEEGSLLGGLLSLIRRAINEDGVHLLPALCDGLLRCCREEGRLLPPALPVSQMLLHIDENLHRPLSVAELSRQAGYSPPYFIRRFRAATGMTPHQYLIHRRLRRAVRLLDEGLPVGRVAERTGYRDLKTFCRAFKGRYGVTPSQYRRLCVPLP